MRVYGKLFGAVIGWLLLRHPIGLVIGGLLGHALDAGWFGGVKPEREHGDTTLSEAYRALGIDADADTAAIDAVYRRLMTQYHPDKVAGAAQEIRNLAEKRAAELNTAYDTIMRARKRAERP